MLYFYKISHVCVCPCSKGKRFKLSTSKSVEIIIYGRPSACAAREVKMPKLGLGVY